MSGEDVRVISGVLTPDSAFKESTVFGKGDVGFGDDSVVSLELWPIVVDFEALSVLPV
jgi:hypothetical protein